MVTINILFQKPWTKPMFPKPGALTHLQNPYTKNHLLSRMLGSSMCIATFLWPYLSYVVDGIHSIFHVEDPGSNKSIENSITYPPNTLSNHKSTAWETLLLTLLSC